MCSELTKKTAERRHWRHYGVFFVNFELLRDTNLEVLLLVLNQYALIYFKKTPVILALTLTIETLEQGVKYVQS